MNTADYLICGVFCYKNQLIITAILFEILGESRVSFFKNAHIKYFLEKII